ncbi:MAG: ketopantoate reductase family protein [Hespellia sp.]|nr:ketopantoate reductase family protein [Hespellia sp.]
MEIKSAALIGLGAMGVFFAPRMEAYLGREDFFVIAEGERKKRLETVGVTINEVNYRFPIVEPKTENRVVDLLIMAVKDSGLDQAIKDIESFVGEKTQILCVMNGVESEEKVAAAYGWEHVLYSYMKMSVVMKNGVANFDPHWGYVHFGEADNRNYSERTSVIADFFKACDIPFIIDEDMVKGLWFKFMCNVGENMTCALLEIPFGAYRYSEHANLIRKNAMREVIRIAQKKGIRLGEEDIEFQEKDVMRIPFQNRPSTLQDLEAGRRTEVTMFAGAVVKMGERLGIETPLNWMFYHAIKVKEEKNEGMFDEPS